MIKAVATSTSSVIILTEERADGGTGALDRSSQWLVEKNNGFVSYSSSSAVFEFAGVATSNDVYTVLRRNMTSGATSIEFRTDSNGLFIGNPDLGVTAPGGCITMDASGNAHTACALADGRVQFSRSTNLNLIYQVEHDFANEDSEVPTRIAVDTSVNRIYAIGSGVWVEAPFDTDVVFTILHADTGGLVHQGQILASTDNDAPAELLSLPGEGFIAGGISAPNSYYRRFSSGASLIWTRSIGSATNDAPQSVARDADGNVVVLHRSSDPNGVKIVRIHRDTGADLGEQPIFIGANTLERELLTDAAGNLYLNVDSAAGSNFMRVQPANLTFSATNVTGGSTVTATIDLAVTNPADQIWNLTSSNPAVASVPTTMTLLATHATGNFPITIHPVTANTNVSINVRHNGFIAQRVLTVIPSVIQSVSVSPQVVVGGVSTTATLTLTGTAPTGGRTVNLVSSKPAVASIPSSAVVLAGQSTVTVPVTTFGVNSNQGVVLTATTGAVSKTAFFAVNAPSLSAISISPSTLQGGTSTSLTLILNGIAPTGGFSIALFSGAPGVVFLPVAASVPASQMAHTINVPTSSVTSMLSVTVFATRSGIYKTVTLTVTP